MYVHIHVGIWQYKGLGQSVLITHCARVSPCPPCRVWDIQTGQVINELLDHSGAVRSLKFTTDTLVTGSHVSGCETATICFCSVAHYWTNQFG